MTKFLDLGKYGIGTIMLPYRLKKELSDPIINMMNISIEDTTDEVFFINLLKIAIEAIKNIPDNERSSADFETTDGELCKIKLLSRHMIAEFYNFNGIDFICSLTTGLDLKIFIEYLLNDYKILAEAGLLKSFTKEDKEYMRIINIYYQELYDLYKTTF